LAFFKNPYNLQLHKDLQRFLKSGDFLVVALFGQNTHQPGNWPFSKILITYSQTMTYSDIPKVAISWLFFPQQFSEN